MLNQLHGDIYISEIKIDLAFKFLNFQAQIPV